MKKAWVNYEERKYEASKAQEQIENYLTEHGYAIRAIREYNSKNEYRVEKNGIQHEFSAATDVAHPIMFMECIEHQFELENRISQ